MKAFIMGKSVLEVTVKSRSIQECGLVRILDDCGVVYETHLSNVIFMEAEHESKAE